MCPGQKYFEVGASLLEALDAALAPLDPAPGEQRNIPTADEVRGILKDFAADPSPTPAPREPTAYLGNLKAAQQLCEIYFEIAAEEIGEDEVRHRRDKRIAAMAEGES
jgi:hypothetical protein